MQSATVADILRLASWRINIEIKNGTAVTIVGFEMEVVAVVFENALQRARHTVTFSE